MGSLASHIALARRIVTVMDLKFKIFGIRFGIDPLLDIIPGFGDLFATLISCYLFWIAYRLRVPASIYIQMGWNILIDYLIGVIPFIGFFIDAFFRANVKNFALLEKYFDPEILEGELLD